MKGDILLMKAITIKQPYATLLALGHKQYETRSWATTYRGDFAIHAGKTMDRKAFEDAEIVELLKAAGYQEIKELPLGAVIATCTLVNCMKVTENASHQGYAMTEKTRIDGIPYKLGDFSEGRYAWVFENMQILTKPILMSGRLSIWDLNI